MTDDWGSKKNGCRVGLRYSPTLEYSADRSQARIHDWDLMFSSDDPMWDTSNDLYAEGGAITNGGAWHNEVYKTSNWSGTMTMRTQSGEWRDLIFGASHTATAKVTLSGISYAGGTLTSTATITYPARAYSLPLAGAAPVITSATSTSATMTIDFPSETSVAPVTEFLVQYTPNAGGYWVGIGSRVAFAGSPVSFTHTGISPGTQFQYRVLGHNDSGYGSTSASSVGVWLLPYGPTIGTATRASDTSITVNWTNPTTGRNSASSNTVYARANGGGWFSLGVVGPAVTSLLWSGGQPNTYYGFAVNSFNVVGWGYSGISNVILNSITAPVSLAVTTPTVTTAHPTAYNTAKSESQTVLSWSHATPTFVQGYDVYVNNLLYWTNLAATSITITGLDAGTNNLFYVRAKRTTSPAGISAASAGITASAPTVTAPPASAAFGSPVASGGKVSTTLSWPAVSGASSYYVQLVQGSGIPNTNVVFGTSVGITNMSPNQVQQFRVFALNAVGYSAERLSGTMVTANIPASPQGVDSSYASGSLFTSWSPPLDDGDAPVTGYQYKIERQEITNGPWILDTNWTSIGNVASLSLVKTTYINYRVTIRAVNGIGPGSEAFAETGLIGGYVRIMDSAGVYQNTYLKLNVASSYSKSAIVRLYDGTDWVPLTYT